MRRFVNCAVQAKLLYLFWRCSWGSTQLFMVKVTSSHKLSDSCLCQCQTVQSEICRGHDSRSSLINLITSFTLQNTKQPEITVSILKKSEWHSMVCWPLIGQYWSRDLNTGLWLVNTSHVTGKLASYWSPEYQWGHGLCPDIKDLFYFNFLKFVFLLTSPVCRVKVYSIHPGIVYTDLYVNVWRMKPLSLLAKYVTIYDVIPTPWYCDHIDMMLWHMIMWHLRAVMKTPEQGGDTLVHAVMDSDLVTRGSGLHLENHRWHKVI